MSVAKNNRIDLAVAKETCRILKLDPFFLDEADVNLIVYTYRKMKKLYHSRDTRELTEHEVRWYREVLKKEGYYDAKQ